MFHYGTYCRRREKIFSSFELKGNSVYAKIAPTAPDGKTKSTQNYNLDAIISVGYHLNNLSDNQFAL